MSCKRDGKYPTGQVILYKLEPTYSPSDRQLGCIFWFVDSRPLERASMPTLADRKCDRLGPKRHSAQRGSAIGPILLEPSSYQQYRSRQRVLQSIH